MILDYIKNEWINEWMKAWISVWIVIINKYSKDHKQDLKKHGVAGNTRVKRKTSVKENLYAASVESAD